jgi:fluoroquinolone resistance protein
VVTLKRITHDEAVRLAAAGDVIEDCDLADVRWRELPVPEVRLKGCVLTDGDLVEAELGDASFIECTFQRCSFASAILSGSLWQRCILFDPSPAAGCRFANGDLDGARFEDCNLSMCSFEGASLIGLSMKGGKATGADFTQASFTRRHGKKLVAAVHFSGVGLDLAVFPQLALDEADFEGSSLRQADFSGSTLSDAVFHGTDATEINVGGATLDRADFREARLEGVDLAAAKSFRAIKVSQSQLPALASSLGIRVFPD